MPAPSLPSRMPSSIVSFVRTYGNANLVLVILGDHQPTRTVVSRHVARHDAPVTIVIYRKSGSCRSNRG